jgi:pseudouridine kinase
MKSTRNYAFAKENRVKMGQSVTVIGTVFMDCKGFAREHYDPRGRNLGDIRFVHGGVGRNVAETLALLGNKVAFVTTVDDTAMGKEIVDRLAALKMDTRYVRPVERAGMGMWLAVLDENGDLAGSVSQMPDLSHLEKLIDEAGENIAEQSSHMVLEMDLNENIVRKAAALAKTHGKPLYGLPGNLDVVLKHRDLLDAVTCFICNDIEAGRLWGKNLSGASGEEILKHLIPFVNNSGLQAMVVTMGERGSVYYEKTTKSFGHQPVFPVRLVDTTGAGDAFFAGTVSGLVRGLPLKEAVVIGSKVAAWTIESPESTCRDLPERMKADGLSLV